TPGATFSDRSRQSVVERSRHGTTTNDRSLTLERFLLPHFVLARYTPLTPRPTHPELAPRRTPMADQIPFGNVELASNPEPRCPCVLLVDPSASMAGTRLSELSAGLEAYQQELLTDTLAAQRVEIAVVTFGGRVETACEFTGVQSFHPPSLVATGDTPMGEA